MWRHFTLCIHASVDIPEFTSQTASPLVQPFLHSSRQTVPCFTMDRPSPQNWPSRAGPGLPSNTWFLGPTRVHIPNDTSIGCRVHDRDRQTNQATPSVTIGRIYVRSTAVRPNCGRICQLSLLQAMRLQRMNFLNVDCRVNDGFRYRTIQSRYKGFQPNSDKFAKSGKHGIGSATSVRFDAGV